MDIDREIPQIAPKEVNQRWSGEREPADATTTMKNSQVQDNERLLEGIARESRGAPGPWGRWGLEGRQSLEGQEPWES